jgi:DNA-binding Lrp family transcriptional regulator
MERTLKTMAKTKPKFNKQERIILQFLYHNGMGYTINEIADKTGLSWVTVRKYLQRLKERGVIESYEDG